MAAAYGVRRLDAAFSAFHLLNFCTSVWLRGRYQSGARSPHSTGFADYLPYITSKSALTIAMHFELGLNSSSMDTLLLSELLVATHNKGKITEIAELLADIPLRLRSLADFPETIEVEETGVTFSENAALKARLYSAQTGIWTLADDSGLEVDALGGAPGVLSARYASPNASDAERNVRLLDELNRTGDPARRARFVCVIAIADPRMDTVNLFTGVCEGRIALSPCGANGFGYDPIFIPEGYEHTFGELSPEIKQRTSHRARALEAAKSFLLDKIQGAA